MSDMSETIKKAIEYAENGDPIKDVICGDDEWIEVLAYVVTLEAQIAEAKAEIQSLTDDVEILQANTFRE